MHNSWPCPYHATTLQGSGNSSTSEEVLKRHTEFLESLGREKGMEESLLRCWKIEPCPMILGITIQALHMVIEIAELPRSSSWKELMFYYGISMGFFFSMTYYLNVCSTYCSEWLKGHISCCKRNSYPITFMALFVRKIVA